MLQLLVTAGSLVAVLCLSAGAQQPAAPNAEAGQGQKSEALRRAFLEADSSRAVIAGAAEQLLAGETASRVRFTTAVSAIAAVAPKAEPKPAATPAPAAGTPSGTDAPKPLEFTDETKSLMASVVLGEADAAKTALAKLVEDKEAGAAALARLDERGKAILARCLVTVVRKKMQTNAIYAGQYDELKDFQPEAGALLLRWTLTPPREVAQADEFRVACLRAVRDIVPADQATDPMRATFRELAAKGQKANSQSMFLTAVCALHQYGDPSIFDQIKASVEKQAESEDETARLRAANTLAELHYNLRKYEEAATHYKVAVELLEKAKTPPQGMATAIYNTACSLSLAQKADEAFQYLEKALQVGQKERALSKAMIDADHDMNNLRADPRFAALMEQFFGKGGTQGK